AGQAITQTMHTVTPAVKNTTVHPVSSATNTSRKHTSANTQVTATTMKTVKPTRQSGNQTTTTGNPTATAVTNTTTTRPVTKTTVTSTVTTVRPTPAPQPSPIPTGTYTVSNGNGTCIKAVMGLQLMAQNTQREQMEYVTVNPNATQTSGSCGMVQSELNLTFSGGFVNFTFVK
ncbi:LAMP3 protein, partial [Serilophus lunatus]|nr:LAMP3 protein [Serilophus lunatus]